MSDAQWMAATLRALPAALLVPAWGLAGAAWPIRLVVAACLAAPIAAGVPEEHPFLSLAHGAPVALAAALPLWLARTHGVIVDAVVGVDGAFARLSATMAGLIFFATAGPLRVSEALMVGSRLSSPADALLAIAAGVAVSIAVAGPLLAAAVALHALELVAARSGGPAGLAVLARDGRRLGVLVAAALVMDRTIEGLGGLDGLP